MNIARRGFLQALGFVAALPLIRKTAWAEGITVDRLRATKTAGSRQYVVSFRPTLVPPGEQATVEVMADASFVIERIIVPTDVGKHFLITSWRVGALEHIFSPFPASELESWGEAHSFRAYEPVLFVSGRTMAFTVTNESSVERTFGVGLIGRELVDRKSAPAESKLLDRLVEDVQAFAREEGYDGFEGKMEGGVLFGKMTRKPARRSLLDRLLRRSS
jgi:hypothetical protein